MNNHDSADLIAIFNKCFALKYNTKLFKGDEEPIYMPAHEGVEYNAIYFAHGFFSSALHECAHWLIAGKERRKQIDFDYWYVPEGRNEEEQVLFQQVEVKPQALEWILSVACAHPFRISLDNLSSMSCKDSDILDFKKAVYTQVVDYCEQGFSTRVGTLRNALCDFYNQPKEFKQEQFVLDTLL